MYVTPRSVRKRQISSKRRLYPIQQQIAAVPETASIANANLPDRSRYKRRIQIVKHHVPVVPAPYADVLPPKHESKRVVETPKAPPVIKSDVSKPVAIKKRKKLKLKTNHLLMAMASAVFVIGVGVALLGFRTNSQVVAQVQGASTDGPDESTPAIDNYVVAPHLPRYISISKLGIKGRILKVGVNNKGQLNAPQNVNDAGWYESSSLPGDAGGAMLVDGHAYGPTKPGIFNNLEQLQSGDQIQIERGDGQVFNFQVVKTQSFQRDQVDMASAIVSVDSARLGLNLITCSGTYNSQTNDYDQRHIVYAVAM